MPLVEKYRPEDFSQVVSQIQVVEPLKEMLKRKEHPPHMLFVGPAGTGKNTVAQCFAKAYFGNIWKPYFIEFNASDSRKIDDVRNKIKPLSQLKVEQIIFLDEVDGMGNDAQHALRRIMEKSQNTIFILSANHQSKIIEPLQSRCAIFRFRPLSDDKILERLITICQSEGIALKFDEDERAGFMQIVKMCHGDLRKAINELEKLITANKEINAKNVIELSKADIVNECVKTALNGDFEKAKNLMEDAYIMSGNNADLIFDDLVQAVTQLNDENLKANFYYKLGELEHHLRTTNRPLVQFIAFIAWVWVAPHLKR